MADPTAERIWNPALRQLPRQVSGLNYDTWLKDAEGLLVQTGNFVVDVWPATRLRSSNLSFSGAKESDQQANFPQSLTIRPLDRSGFRCYVVRHPLLTDNSPGWCFAWEFPQVSGSEASPKIHCVGLQPAPVEPALSKEAERRQNEGSGVPAERVSYGPQLFGRGSSRLGAPLARPGARQPSLLWQFQAGGPRGQDRAVGTHSIKDRR